MEMGIRTVCGSPENPDTWIYQIKESGIYVREAQIESVAAGRDKTTIVQITDVHLNDTNAADEGDDEIMYTRKCRTWNADGISVKALRNAMEYAGKYDRTVITGDTLDYLSQGAMELMRKAVWEADESCIVTLGGHDVTKQMQTGRPNRLPLRERQKLLEAFWRHDMYYFSEILHDNVLLIQMDNGCHRYWDFQIPRLAADIRRARERGLTILIFQHEAVCTGRPEDARFPAFYVWEDCEADANFYDECVGCALTSDAPTMEIYRMITENADIVRGIFCGHHHTSFYMEVEGSYRGKDGKAHRKTIPQYLLECNVYGGYTGHVLKITV